MQVSITALRVDVAMTACLRLASLSAHQSIRRMSSVTTHQTALCLIPPESLWAPIQAIRSVHDKAYPRWMPHINLIFPFAPESKFAEIKEQLGELLLKRKPLDIEFDPSSLHYFPQKGSECTFHLRPKLTADVVELQGFIQQSLAGYLVTGTRPFEAHLTLGQTTNSRISDVLIEMKAKWQTMRFTIDRVCMISRENDPNGAFEIKSQMYLLCHKDKQIDLPIAPPPPARIDPPHALPSKTSLCLVPPDEFSARLLRLLEGTSFRPVKPFRIVLCELDNEHIEPELRARFESMRKVTVDFGPRSICFNYSTSRLFLKPTDGQALDGFNALLGNQVDGTLTLGQLDKKDVPEVGDRFTQSWTMGNNEFEVDRVHLIDADGRFRCSLLLRSQYFS